MQGQVSEPTGSLADALGHAMRLLSRDPQLAREQALAILEAVPRHPGATLILAAALRLSGDASAALPVIDPLSRALPDAPDVQLEHGLVLLDLGRTQEAVAALRRATSLDPNLVEAWRALSVGLTVLGDLVGAQAAGDRQVQASVCEPALIAAATALVEGGLPEAEHGLRAYLATRPDEPAALRMLAEVAARLGRYEDAERILTQTLAFAPGFTAARHNLATLLYRQNKTLEALGQLDLLQAADPRHPAYANLRAAALVRIGEYEAATAIYREVLARHPHQPKGWMSYGHALKTLGRRAECEAAYRRAVEQAPMLGEAWWSLANLKTLRFSDDDFVVMEGQLASDGLADEDRFHLHYALGKALEDAGRYEQSFGHYARGAELRRIQIRYDADETTAHAARSKALLTPAFFAERRGWGAAVADPIFVVGLPRSGSTLIEQILASHSQVEGTMELPDVIAIAKRLGGRRGEGLYPEALATLDAGALRALGEEYLERTRVQRKTDRPFFVDKMPNNFAHAGLIHLMLPNARIIDARRHPLGCCFSGFKQHFARGQTFSYGLEDIGRYYADYVDLMAHFDAVLPGRVHRVIYEDMVQDPEGQIRRLLDHCGLPFEDACLNFHQNDRAVRTASSEQVRQPIFKDGVDQWRNYEPWLDPLKAALGPVLAAYPDAPVI